MSAKEKIAAFQGFTPETLSFLSEVRSRNSKSWFEDHRSDYEILLLGPMRGLVGALGGYMMTIDAYFETRPAVGKTISRIYRDTRFSKDKSLFRDHLWFTFKRPIQEWQDSPGYFFEINPGGYCYGMGFYMASRETMAAFRKLLDRDAGRFLKVIVPLREGSPFRVEGDCYKRILAPGKPAELLEWYQRKNFYLISEHQPDDSLFGKELADRLIDDYQKTVPLYHFLWEAIQLKGEKDDHES